MHFALSHLKTLLRSAAATMLLVAAVSLLPVASAPAMANVEYQAPANPIHQPLHDRLRAERWLERMQDAVQHIRMPEPVRFRLANCGGRVEAWFFSRTVAVCYEYLQVVIRRADAGQLSPWVTREEALAGAFVDALLHEFGHAMIEHLKLPVLGREEEAADQISALLMLRLGQDRSVSLVKGTAQVYLSWMNWNERNPQGRLGTGALIAEASAHPTPAQRLYNLVCLAIGANPAAFDTLAKAVDLPQDRAEDCDDEYTLYNSGLDRLLGQHIDTALEPEARKALQSFVVVR